MGLAAVFALVWTIKTRKTFPAIITVGMILGIILALFPSKTIQTLGLYVYMGFVSFAFIYVKMNNKQFKNIFVTL